MGGLMSWESAKRELKKLYKNPEKQLLSINDDSNSYILEYRCTDMSKQQTTKEIGYCGCSFCEYNKANGRKYNLHMKVLK